VTTFLTWLRRKYVSRVLAMASVAYVVRRGEIVYSGALDGLVDDLFEHYPGA
jgi:ABC-type branched-subunit amino acid transport system ATPase component